MEKITINNHTLEFRQSSCTIDPWSLDYYEKEGTPMIAGQAITDFLLLDNYFIYRIDRYFTDDELLMLQTTEQLQNWLNSKCKLIKTIDQIGK